MWAREVLADACFEQLRGVGAMACCEMVECVSTAGTATHGIAIGSAGPLALNSTPSPVDTLPAMSVGRPPPPAGLVNPLCPCALAATLSEI
ncbi:unnamed protein product [Clonostachys chloroleuca]|uniref:Uncharacterized protein n=1 Tax=Clonostachys chloroleuca TaxID=1926264 RepID=A0AA35QDQ4_9HYPO|nr:unnamed protein product [Clonostachys chloroleuca]